MSIIDKQRIAALTTLEALGYTFSVADGWAPTAVAQVDSSAIAEADAMHALLVLRADNIAGSNEGSQEEAELASITDAVKAYEAKRWPAGREATGKG
jgi:hypothetical protein